MDHGSGPDEPLGASEVAVIARALQEQLSEQRELHRLVEGVEDAVRGVRDQLGTLGRHLEGSDPAGAEQVERVTDRLRVVEEALIAALEDRAAQQRAEELGERVQQVDARVERVGGELADLRGELADLDLGGQGAVVAERLDDLLHRTAGVQDERLAALQDAVGRTEQATRDALVAVDRTVEAARRDAAGQLERLTDAVTALEQRTSASVDTAVGDAVAVLRDRVEEIRVDLERHMNSVSEAAVEAAARAERLDARAGTFEAAVGEARRTIAETLSTVEQSVGEALRATQTRMDESAGAAAASISERVSAARTVIESAAATARYDLIDAVERAMASLADAVERSQATLDERAATSTATLDERAGQVATLLSDSRARLVTEVQEVNAAVRAAREVFDAVTASLGADVDTVVDGARARLVEDLTQLAERLSTRADEVVANAFTELRGALSSAAETVRDEFGERAAVEVAGLQAAAEALQQGAREAAAEVHGSARAAAETLEGSASAAAEALERSVGQAAGTVDDAGRRVEAAADSAAARLREQVDEAGEALRASVEGAVGDTTAQLGETVSRLDRLVERFGRLEDTWDAQRRADSAAIEALRSTVRDDVERLVALAEERLSDAAGTLAERADAADMRADAAVEALSEQTERLDERLAAAVGEAVEAARELFGEEAAGLRREVGGVLGEVRQVGRGLEATVDGVEGLRERLVGYLADRDRVVEREREQLLVTLLEEFVRQLSRREARKAVERMGVARDQARDRRDAERWRELQQRGGQPASEPSPAEALGVAGQVAVPDPLRGTEPLDPPEPVTTDDTGEVAVDEGDWGEEAWDEEAWDEEVGVAVVYEGPAERTCDECGFVAKTPGGLASHRRVHKRE